MSAPSSILARVRSAAVAVVVLLAAGGGVAVAVAAPVDGAAAPVAGHPWVLTDRVPTVADPLVTAVDCGGASDCWTVEGGLLLQSGDLGASWADRSALLPTGTRGVDDLSCPAVGHCRLIVETDTGPVLLVLDGADVSSRPVPVLNGDTRIRVSCSSVTRCLLATYGALVLRTTDAGLTWGTGTLPRGFAKPSISCVPGGTLCLEVGNSPNGARSLDGGRTWEKVTLPAAVRSFDDAECATADTCWLAAAGGGLLRTSDGGDTWATVSLPPAAGGAVAITCVSALQCRTVGYVGTYPAPYHQSGATTTDGVTWTVDSPSVAATVSALDVACVGALRCLTVWAGTARRTSLVAPGIETGLPAVVTGIGDADCLSVLSCVAVGTDAAARAVAVHGAPGSIVVTPMPAAVGRPDLVDCVGRTTCTVLSSAAPARGGTPAREVWRTVDGGATWSTTPLPGPSTGANRALSCPSATTCLAVGRLGTTVSVATTSDGQTWTARSAPTGATDLAAVSCATTTSCVALGVQASGPTAWRSPDLGATWSPVTPTTALRDGYDQLTCWRTTCLAASEQYGTTARSTDGGATWTRRTAPGPGPLFSLTCTPQGRCAAFAAARGPVVSENGGLTWRQDSAGGGSFGCVGAVCVAVSATNAGLAVWADGLPAGAGGATGGP